MAQPTIVDQHERLFQHTRAIEGYLKFVMDNFEHLSRTELEGIERNVVHHAHSIEGLLTNP